MRGFIGGEIGYRILKKVGRQDSGDNATAYTENDKVEKLLGKEFWNEIFDKTVLDFGCGFGEESIEIAERGARKVIGLDIREEVLRVARENAFTKGVSDKCSFVSHTEEKADVIVSIDAFEHFDDPASILRMMRGLIKESGKIIAVFGPTWFHPLGGHLFSVFPFAHLIFTENALIRWRSDFKCDGATRFNEVAGGLNGMTISRFESLIRESDFRFEKFETVPIKKLHLFANRLTREITTSVVRCQLIPRSVQT